MGYDHETNVIDSLGRLVTGLDTYQSVEAALDLVYAHLKQNEVQHSLQNWRQSVPLYRLRNRERLGTGDLECVRRCVPALMTEAPATDDTKWFKNKCVYGSETSIFASWTRPLGSLLCFR